MFENLIDFAQNVIDIDFDFNVSEAGWEEVRLMDANEQTLYQYFDGMSCPQLSAEMMKIREAIQSARASNDIPTYIELVGVAEVAVWAFKDNKCPI